MSTTTSSDVATNIDTSFGHSEDEAIDAFMTHLGVDPDEDAEARKRKKPSEEVKEDTTEDDAAKDEGAEDENSDESPEDEADSDEDEATEEDAEKASTKKFVDSTDHAATFVKVKVGDEDKEVSVKDLTRLYGQEASLTRKSQEVADQRRVADEGVAKNVAALNVMLEKAKAKAAPYQNIDWLAVSKNPNISAEEASALRDEAKAAIEDVNFFEKDLGTLMTTIADKQKADTVAQAKTCIEALSTPGTDDKPNPLHIEGWNDKVYDDLRSFARELGADARSVNAMVDPVAFKVLHMAMQFKKGSSKVLTVKTNKSPKKIVKASSSTPAARDTSASVSARNKAVTNLKRTGSEEDAVNAFLSGMADKD